MNEADILVALCCLAGADGALTVEELQVLDGLAERAGIEQKAFRVLIEKAGSDEDFRQKQIDVVCADAAAALKTFMGIARQDDRIGEGRLTMLLWRIATNQLGLSPDQFESLIAAET